mgnify:CR=1 FL=1
MEVTPFVGVWIETYSIGAVGRRWQSHPSWVCGLKLTSSFVKTLPVDVTPFVGVWIETTLPVSSNKPLLRHTLRGCVD